MARAVPTIERIERIDRIERMASTPATGSEPASNNALNNGLPCSGRCGRCDCHPCQLHAPI